MTVKREDVKLYLFGTSNIDDDGFHIRNIVTDDHKINRYFPVKILIHGWMDDKNSYWYPSTVQAYKKKGGVNVITVSWGKHAKALYSYSIKAVRSVGYHIAQSVMEISEKYGIPFENFHLIGHSLGAHISGFAGKKIISEQNRKIGRITGLDPALPSFENVAPEDRLCSNDAAFVDIIHTDGGSLGYETSIGHVDFYPNGGKRRQNGCGKLDLGCSHKRAPIYFCESINTLDFVAVEARNFTEFDCGRCKNNRRAIMGENVDRSIMGDFYLHTNKESPFAKGFMQVF